MPCKQCLGIKSGPTPRQYYLKSKTQNIWEQRTNKIANSEDLIDYILETITPEKILEKMDFNNYIVCNGPDEYEETLIADCIEENHTDIVHSIISHLTPYYKVEQSREDLFKYGIDRVCDCEEGPLIYIVAELSINNRGEQVCHAYLDDIAEPHTGYFDRKCKPDVRRFVSVI